MTLGRSRFLEKKSQQVSTLQEWQKTGIETAYQSLWSSHRRFFHRKGYILWRQGRFNTQLPPNDNSRAPDGFSYENAYSATQQHTFYIANATQHAARTVDNRDVIIVLLSDGVIGVNAVEALQAVGMGVTAAIDRNHTLPVLQLLYHGNLIFGVFPMVGSCSVSPWFRCMGEALEAMSQIMEGVAFLHDRHVAHRDLFMSNFLPSRRNGGWDPNVPGSDKDFLRPRFYIIDFEWAVHFPSNSDAAKRTVVGPPIAWELYHRPAPPEMRTHEPHCPFKTDVWQLGCTFLQCFKHLENDIPEIIKLLELMRADSADTRPTARDAVERLNSVRLQMLPSILQQSIDEAVWPLTDDEDDM